MAVTNSYAIRLWLHRIAMISLFLIAPLQPCLPGDAASLRHELAPLPLEARVIAVGIPEPGAVAAVGFFHPGGPLHENAALSQSTRRGRILDPTRILVGGQFNFGARRALADAPEGSVLSLDPDGDTLAVPADFGAAGDQASALHGRVRLFTAQSSRYTNQTDMPVAATVALPAVSNPLGISNNNAFGLPWFVNSPQGNLLTGFVSAVDASGSPNSPPRVVTGTNGSAAVASAFLGPSPDGSQRAAYAVLTAGGAIAQVQSDKDFADLVPLGVLDPVLPAASSTQSTEHSGVVRTGMVYNWSPDRILYVADPVHNAVIALTLLADEQAFRFSAKRSMTSRKLDVPIDLAPANPEVADRAFSSNTSLAAGSDIYVANRGNGTIVRMRQDGVTVAVRRVTLPGGRGVGRGRLNGIAVSPDARRIWLTVSGALPEYPHAPGALLEVPAFGKMKSYARAQGQPVVSLARTRPNKIINRGERLFGRNFRPEEGLGPFFNAPSCLECHRSPRPGGTGLNGLAVVHRLAGPAGPIVRAHTIAELGMTCSLAPEVPAGGGPMSLRNAPALFGLGEIEGIPDAVILAGAAKVGNKDGRLNVVRDAQGRERIGRYGRKADVASLEQFVANAFRDELGITSPLAPTDLVTPPPDCRSRALATPEADGAMIRAVTAFVASLPPPSFASEKQDQIGRILFSAMGCPACHTPALPSPMGDVPLFSDLLLHDMGSGLDDGIAEGQARGRDWRTTPLWGLRMRSRFLHDGRARSINDAILAHDGDGREAREGFQRLTQEERDSLHTFLLGL